ncbi:MAG: 2-oxoacid ferredoxin oxidoreductase [Chloroflexi bacterium]|nr:2-oxoacid ferredoxin oxidoreductase [Chloroflexota bacterium]|tara:strand:- start:3288 stop:4154 length:867 start_codon:yes stop_codon:yes gene_type:complete
MSAKNPEYDFKWCPGCGDFGVRRALEFAMQDRMVKFETPMSNNVVVAGIGCSGNLVHLLEGEQPFGFHGIHGRALPIAFGTKMANPDLNVVVVAGDGDFLSIGMEHIAPQASRNLNITAVVMDNGVYGLTKGQSSPTTVEETVTSSTPFGKLEPSIQPLDLYLTLGVSFIASGYSSKPKDLASIISSAMEHPGFSVVHVASPCTTYNDTYEQLKGNASKGIEPMAWSIPDDHNAEDKTKAKKLIDRGGVPLGIIYQDTSRPPLEVQIDALPQRAKVNEVATLLDTFDL